jgi:hypothetical protein
MEKLFISPTPTTPEITFSPEEGFYQIRGTSSPEDVRALYYPVILWIKNFADSLISGDSNNFSSDNPLKFRIELDYFNSSSAKFLYDIVYELKRLPPAGIPVVIEWYHDEEDIDLLEAGQDISLLVDMEFRFISK